MTKKEKQDCPGYYEVSGYTTSNGKKVDDYIRHCWKHGYSNVNQNINFDQDPIFKKGNPTEESVPNDGSSPTNSKPDWSPVLGNIFHTALQLYLNNNSQTESVNYDNYTNARYVPQYMTQNYQNYNFSKFDAKKTEEDIKSSMKNTEEILKKKIITKDDILKIDNQNLRILHNLLDDIEDLSIQKSNLPEIITLETMEQGQKIEDDRKQLRENAYLTILTLYQVRNVVEKQWKNVSSKDKDYDNKFQQYYDKKQEIEKLSDTAKDLFDYASEIDDTTFEKIKKLRDELGLMRLRPILQQKDNNLEQKWIWPCKGSISSPYGWRIHPIKKEKIFHSGIDIKVKEGTPVRAIADGKIFAARSGMTGYGTGVFIDHGKVDGKYVRSEYGHLSRYCVKYGQYVKQGEIIGYSGNTGDSTGPHLHLTIRISIDNIHFEHKDPLKYLPKY